MYRVFKYFFFLLPPESAHRLAVILLGVLLKIPVISSLLRNYFTVQNPQLHRTLWGLQFPNPVGLAAGFDKDGKYLNIMPALGFGFMEIGTVTPKSQPGNPKPRLFRIPQDKVLINRMGFNNDGMDALVRRIENFRRNNILIGVNIGKNKDTPNEKAADDYVKAFERLYPYADYFAINVSSPNTPGLRELQEKEPLKLILRAIQKSNESQINPKPILLKIAPDLTYNQIDEILEVIQETKINGIIATNTTIQRAGLSIPSRVIEKIGPGGLSGNPLKDRSTQVVRYISKKTRGTLPVIAVGGIASAQDALEKIEAGATLVQVYTGLIYSGPSLIKNINRSLASGGYK